MGSSEEHLALAFECAEVTLDSCEGFTRVADGPRLRATGAPTPGAGEYRLGLLDAQARAVRAEAPLTDTLVERVELLLYG